MPDRGGGPTGPRIRVGRPSRRVRTLLMTLGVLAVLAMAFVMFAGFWTDWLWYRSVAYSSVFTTTLWTKIGLFLVFGLLMALAIGLNIWLAHRLRPPLSAMSLEQQSLDRYRMSVAPYKKWVLLAVTALVGLIAGASASGQWRTWLMYVNGVPFGQKDPQFKLDVSFYAFDLPWYRFLLGFGFAAVVLSLIAAAVTHYLYGGLRITSPGARATGAATGHLSVLLGVFVTLKAVAYWLDRYGLAVKSSDFKATDNWTGLRYVDANAYLPAKTILFCIAVICAVLFFATLWRRTWQLPVIGFGLMVLSAILIGGLYPAIVQKFQVQPNEQAKEAPFIQKNIDATRDAYDIDDAKVDDYAGTSTTDDSTKLRASADSAASYRVMDPNVVSPAVPAAPAEEELLPVPQDAGRRPLQGRGRQGAGHRHRPARAEPPGPPQEELDQRPLHVHPRLRRHRGPGHHDGHQPDGIPGLHGVGPAHHGRAGQVRAADLLRREDRAVLHRRRAPEGARLRGGRREDHQLQGRQRGQPRQRLQPGGLRGLLQRAADPVLGSHRRRLADPLQPHAQGARRGGRTLADHRRRRLPGGRRRPHPVDRRRVHHDQRLSVRLAYDAR